MWTRSEKEEPTPGNGESASTPDQSELILEAIFEAKFQLAVEPFEDIYLANVGELLKSVTEDIQD